MEFALQHPLLTAEGSAQTAGAPQAKVRADHPAAGTVRRRWPVHTLEGHTTLDLNGAMQDGATQLARDRHDRPGLRDTARSRPARQRRPHRPAGEPCAART